MIRYLIALILFTTSFVSDAKTLTIGLGNFKPLFSEPNEPALFKDIIDGVFAYLPQYEINYHYMLSNARLLKELKTGRVDGSANIFSTKEFSGCLTNPTFRYSDVAISKKRYNFKINRIRDLSGKSIVTYQRALNLLGEEFYKVATSTEHYREIAQPEEQAILLAKDFADVSIGDKYIFLHSIGRNQQTRVNVNDFEFHPIFPLVYSSMGFSEQKYCDDFNQGLQKFKQSGEYEKVYEQHLIAFGYVDQNNS